MKLISKKIFMMPALVIIFFLCNLVVVRGNETDSLLDELSKSDGKAKLEIYDQVIRLKMKSSPLDALSLAFEARDLAKKLKKPGPEANYISNIAIGYYYLGDYEQAFRYLNEALDMYRTQNNAEGEAKTQSNLGLIYRDWENFEPAIDHMNKALEIFDSLDHKIGIASCYNNIGTVYQMKGDTENTKIYLEKSLAIKKEINDKYGIANTLNNLAIIAQYEGDFDKANSLYEESLSLKREIADSNGIANAYLNISNMYGEMDNLDSLFTYAEMALSIGKDKGLKHIQKEACHLIYQYYKNRGNYEMALEYNERFNNLKDTIFNENSMKKILGYQARIDLERIERENEILRLENEFHEKSNIYTYAIIVLGVILIIVLLFLYRNNKRSLHKLEDKNQQISRINKKLSDQNWLLNHNKEKLAQMNEKMEESRDKLKLTNSLKDKFFYFITNQMNEPAGMLRENIAFLKEKKSVIADPEVQEKIDELGNIVAAGGRMYQNILRLSKAQVEGSEYKPEKVDIGKVSKTIINTLKSRPENTKLNIENAIEESTIAYGTWNIIEIIFDLLLQNAVKNTSENGQVKLNTRNLGDFFEIEVMNTGSGISPEDYSNYFSTEHPSPGSTGNNGSGFDMFICKEFIKIIGGRIWVESHKGKDLRIKFTLSRNPGINE